MITPHALKPGDLIGIVSPAKRIEEKHIDNAVKVIEALGYKIKLGKHALASNHYFAGTDRQRTEDFQLMLDDPDIKMILCSRGGYGSARIIDRLDFSKFMKSPRWIAGYSDITVFHAQLLQLGVESLHSTMPLDFPEDGQISQAVKMLFQIASGKKADYKIEPRPHNRNGKVKGMLVGGNLSMICSLLGSPTEVDTVGKILFIEEVGEDLYRLDRMMQTLKRAGKLTHLRGLIVGGLSGMFSGNPDFGLTAEEIILDAVSNMDFPVAFDFPAGHFRENYPLIMGRKVVLNIGGNVTVDFELNR